MSLVDDINGSWKISIFTAATYLAYDTQMIVGGTHRKKQYGQKEYILAALNLYQDALNLFVQIMRLLGKSDDVDDGDDDRSRSRGARRSRRLWYYDGQENLYQNFDNVRHLYFIKSLLL